MTAFNSRAVRGDVTYSSNSYHPRSGECDEQSSDPTLAWMPSPQHVFHVALPRSRDRRDRGAGSGWGHPDRLHDDRRNGGSADSWCAPRVDRRRCQRKRSRGCRCASGLLDSRMRGWRADSPTTGDRDLRCLGRGDMFPVRAVLAWNRMGMFRTICCDRCHAIVRQDLGTRRSGSDTEPLGRLLGSFSTSTTAIAATSAAQSANELSGVRSGDTHFLPDVFCPT